MSSREMVESALYGIKLHVDRYGDAVTDALERSGIHVVPSPGCFKVLHTSFQGSMDELIKQIPELSLYPVKQYKWWHKLTDSIKT
jgi:hypothetical protein